MAPVANTTQKRFLDAATKVAQEPGFEVTQDLDWANVGTLSVYNPGSFTAPVARMSFSFHTDYANIVIYDHEGKIALKNTFVQFSKGQLDEVLTQWKQLFA